MFRTTLCVLVFVCFFLSLSLDSGLVLVGGDRKTENDVIDGNSLRKGGLATPTAYLCFPALRSGVSRFCDDFENMRCVQSSWPDSGCMLLRPSTELKVEFRTFLHEGGLTDSLGVDVTEMFPYTGPSVDTARASVCRAFTRCHTSSM